MWWLVALAEPDRRPLDAGWPWYFTVVVVGVWVATVVGIVTLTGRQLARRRGRRRPERLALTAGDDSGEE